MTGTVNRRGPRDALLLLAGLALAGCDSLEMASGVALATADRPQAATASATDVEAPEVFRVAEAGLWDGRPSLGGIWVAHPDVTDPERVRIVNTTNGQEVVGALFRRERDLPGPALQVSSDAAEALGMLAGAPAPLEVTALRRQEPPPAEEPAATAEAAPAADAAPAEPPGEVDPAAVEATARATAAILAGAPAAPAPGAIATTTLESAPAAEAPASALDRPFVQIGTYGAEANARAVATQIASQGLPVTVVESQGSWRLLLGPATTEAQAAALLEGAVAAGFADAYLVAS